MEGMGGAEMERGGSMGSMDGDRDGTSIAHIERSF
jgi:hypothetical protein